MATLIVHPGTGTVIDAHDGTLIVSLIGGQDSLTDEDVTFYALHHGVPVASLLTEQEA